MNWIKYLVPILKQTDFLLVGISLLLIVFYRFFIKAQFSKNANLKLYAMLMYFGLADRNYKIIGIKQKGILHSLV